jgi:Catalase
MRLHEQEVVTPFEERYATDLLARLKKQLIEEHPSGIMPRDAHPKMHGLVEAEFTVLGDLSESHKIGIFAQAKTYKTWVRFSNANGISQPDLKRDIRGIAIKLTQVQGEKLNITSNGSESDCADDQDFLLISTNTFLCGDIQTFDGMVKAIQGSWWQKLCFFATHPNVIFQLVKSFKVFANPLQIRYFSCTPYLLGEHAVKYCVTPVIRTSDYIPPDPGEDFLRLAMKQQLKTETAEFVFGIQLQTNPRSMPIEDASVGWDETASPFVTVATLRIPLQDFDTPQRNEQGENMRFSPWHCLPVHRPLGSINRARRLVYHGISELRRRVNGVI